MTGEDNQSNLAEWIYGKRELPYCDESVLATRKSVTVKGDQCRIVGRIHGLAVVNNSETT
jgi:hypothetical protein